MENEGRGIGIGPVRIPDYLRPVYANYVTVNHTPWDYRLLFAVVKAPAPGSEQQQAEATGHLEPEAVAEVILPANLMAGFMTALKQNFDKYLASYGVPGMDPMGPQPQE